MPAIKTTRSRMPSRRFPFSGETTSPALVSAGYGTADVPRGPPRTLPARILCGIVRQVTAEMLMLVGDRVQLRRDRRRSSCHVRQIAMYVCHVALQMRMTTIGEGFGRDRSTVAHACAVVEDRRDDAAFDDFVSAVERVILSVFGAAGGCEDA